MSDPWCNWCLRSWGGNPPWEPGAIPRVRLERRTAILQQAYHGPSERMQIEALQSLWRIWHCRLPLVEAQVGWKP